MKICIWLCQRVDQLRARLSLRSYILQVSSICDCFKHQFDYHNFIKINDIFNSIKNKSFKDSHDAVTTIY